jgi:large subunit ribosomal protein L17
MRHGKKFNHLGRTAPHRKAMLSNMASSLIMEKRITTTVAKAKALRKYVEPLLTKSKTDDTNSRRVVFSYLQNKESVSELFNEVSDKIASRPGGYTRILKTGNRLGDNADMCIIELVDYNDALLKEAKPEKAKTRRSRRGKGGSSEEDAAKPVETKAVEVEEEVVAEEAEAIVEDAVIEEAVIEEAVVEEAIVEEAPVVAEEVVEDAAPEVEAAAETVEETLAEEAKTEETESSEEAKEEDTDSQEDDKKE